MQHPGVGVGVGLSARLTATDARQERAVASTLSRSAAHRTHAAFTHINYVRDLLLLPSRRTARTLCEAVV
jgi:hypothetical protein